MPKTDRQKFNEAVWRQGAPAREAEVQRMLNDKVPYKERITLALDSRGLDGPEVDIALGGEEPMVDEWETGERIPIPSQVVALAELTEYPIPFFYHPVAEMGLVFMCGELTNPRTDSWSETHSEVVESLLADGWSPPPGYV